MKSPFVWGKGGRAMTPEDVERERELVALARAKMGDTSPATATHSNGLNVRSLEDVVRAIRITPLAPATDSSSAQRHPPFIAYPRSR